MIDINFDGLFSIELLHKYFTNQLCPDFSITPSAKSMLVINGHRLVVKQYHNTLYTGIQSNAGNPFISIENGMQMTFYMWLNNPFFFNYTNLPTAYDPGKIFYFTNRNNNTANGKNFLSASIAAYNNSVSYIPGDLAADGTGIVYRAIRSNNPVNQFPLSNSDYWTAIDTNEYTAGSDVLQFLPSVSAYSFGASSQSAATLSVLGYNSITNDYTSLVLSNTINFVSPVYSFILDLSSLKPGKYSLTVNGAQQWIYINDELINNRPFGVIDIVNEATPASAKLVTGAGALISPVYAIYFLNRATLWNYVLPVGETGSISDAGSTYNFITVTNTITSTAPIPLSDSLLDFQLTVNGNQINPIPCADGKRLTSLILAGDTYACSEIFLNY
jgi:hypothetical protein